MDKNELEAINAAHDFLDALEAMGEYDTADRFLDEYGYFFEFDRKGNWVGKVPNENGITNH